MEADDVIATLARRAEERGFDVFIVTADKDARQLISDQVRILNLRKNKLIDAAELEKEWGIRPDQVVDFLALTGDTVDNVPGVPGIGEGFAATFLKQFGTLDQLLANISQVKGPKKQQSLREHADTARRARQLVTLRDDLPLALDWDALKTQSPDVEALEIAVHRVRLPPVPRRAGCAARPVAAQGGTALGGHLSRRRYARAVRRFPRRAKTAAAVLHRHRDHRDRPAAGRSGRAVVLLEVRRGLLLAAARARRIEPARPAQRPSRHCGLSSAIRRSKRSARISSTTCSRSSARAFNWHGPLTDTMVLSYLLESGERNHNLDQLSAAAARPHHDSDHRLDRQRKEPGPNGPGRRRPGRRVRRRGCRRDLADSRRSWRPQVRDQGLWTLYAELERPLIAVLAGMEAAGVKVDVERLKQLSREFAERIATIETEAFRLGRPDVQHQLGASAPPGAVR